MATYPKLDLPPIPDDLVLHLQNGQLLDITHQEGENNSFFYSTAHTALGLASDICIETPQLVAAMDTGAKIFESIGHHVHPDKTYDGIAERAMVFGGAQQYVSTVRSSEDFLVACDIARCHLLDDAPDLAEMLEEVAGKYTHHDAVATRFALNGAAVLRGMQIFVDKRLEAAA